MDCIYCSTVLPDKGYYCPKCTKQNKCKACEESLIKDATICVVCGTELNKTLTASNVNTIEYSETKSTRTFKGSFSDKVGEGISDFLSSLVTNKLVPKTKPLVALPSSPITPTNDNTVDAEVISEPANPTSEIERFQKIFRVDGDKTTISETRLKATSKLNYGQRLAILFLYFKFLSGSDSVPRRELTSVMLNASVEDGNFRKWLLKNPHIGVTNGLVEIKASGKEHAKNYINDIENSEVPDVWVLGTPSKAGRKAKEKKGSAKNK